MLLFIRYLFIRRRPAFYSVIMCHMLVLSAAWGNHLALIIYTMYVYVSSPLRAANDEVAMDVSDLKV